MQIQGQLLNALLRLFRHRTLPNHFLLQRGNFSLKFGVPRSRRLNVGVQRVPLFFKLGGLPVALIEFRLQFRHPALQFLRRERLLLQAR